MPKAREEPLNVELPFEEALQRFIRVNPRVEEPAVTYDKAAPFIKWAGGKRSIIDELVRRLPAELGTYWEPFAGGAALFFEIHDRLVNAVLSESNLELVITYNAVKRDLESVIAKLEEHARKHNSKYYYRIRAKQFPQDPIEVAARFLYLNKTCYNGLYRVNKAGEFNVPVGSYVNPEIVQRDGLKLASAALQMARIEYREFDTITPQRGDFVYCDPPYHPTSSGNFTKYTKLDFTEKDQIRLRDFATKLHREGVNVMVSNSDTSFIRDLYTSQPWHIVVVQAPRLVNCKPEGRGAVNELIVTNYTTP